MASDDNFIRVYGNKNNNEEKKNSSTLNKLKKANSFLSLVFFCLWIVSVITTFRRGYKEYYVYTIIFIVFPFLFTVASNFYILKKLKDTSREILRIVGKASVIFVLILYLINPNALIITKKLLNVISLRNNNQGISAEQVLNNIMYPAMTTYSESANY